MGTEGDDVARLIEGRLEQHDRNQFEVKLDYTIDRAKAKNRYEVNAYFFLPKSLGVDAQTYPKAQFYSDIQAHIRFKTPGLSLQDLARTDAGDSPLGKILRSLDSPSRGAARPGQQARLSQELRLVGCLMRANLRDRVRETCRRLRALAQSNPAAGHELDLLRSEIQALVEEARCVLLKYRLLRTSFSPPRFEASLSETYQLVDEYMSLTVEGHLTRLLESLQDATAQGWAVAAETELLGKSILDERAHRRGFGHESLPAVEGGNETLVYRLGLLKKFVMSVLFGAIPSPWVCPGDQGQLLSLAPDVNCVESRAPSLASPPPAVSQSMFPRLSVHRLATHGLVCAGQSAALLQQPVTPGPRPSTRRSAPPTSRCPLCGRARA